MRGAVPKDTVASLKWDEYLGARSLAEQGCQRANATLLRLPAVLAICDIPLCPSCGNGGVRSSYAVAPKVPFFVDLIDGVEPDLIKDLLVLSAPPDDFPAGDFTVLRGIFGANSSMVR